MPVLAALTLAAGAVTAGCGPSGEPPLTVLAASSLTDVLGPVLDGLPEDVQVEVSYTASSTIVQQVRAGAPADVVVLAGTEPLAALPEELVVSGPEVLATNSLQIAVPPANPAGVTGPADLAGPGLTLVLCQEQVPCGAAARTFLDRAGLDPAVASYEPDVRAALARVEQGEADAAVVYRTDVLAAGDRVRGVAVPADLGVTTSYPVLVVSDHPRAPEVVATLLSDRARRLLSDAGFGVP